ncbi:Guanine nucleotide exchange factor for Cdc42p [Dimargaris xerosporica]|nr:Guanine nucleotide exchange factor for Cdc42p [Dimargaris xerosporica]
MHSVTLRRRAPSQAGTAHTIELPLPATPPQPTAPPTSLYQRCLQLMDRLAMVPGFSQFLEPAQPDSSASSTTLSDGSTGPEAKGDDTYLDPVKYLSTIFRNGLSLIALYNALKPEKPINYDPGSSMSQSNQDKLKIFLFLKAIKEIGLVKDGSNAPIVNDLLSDDTNAFMKVLDIVTLLLDELEKCGKLDHSTHQKPSLRFSDTDTKRPESNRERVVAEMLETERKYVSDLERLQKYMQEIQSRQILPEETVRLMFANLNSLLNFQRRFLIGVEANSRKISIEQQFGALFTKMEEGFSVYEPYVANHERAAEIAVREAPVLAVSCLAPLTTSEQLVHFFPPHIVPWE